MGHVDALTRKQIQRGELCSCGHLNRDHVSLGLVMGWDDYDGDLPCNRCDCDGFSAPTPDTTEGSDG